VKTSHREIVAVLKAGGSLVRFEHAKAAYLMDATGRTLRTVRIFTLWDMTDAGLIVGNWRYEEGDCEDMEYTIPLESAAS
jgi:hypothetical protein